MMTNLLPVVLFGVAATLSHTLVQAVRWYAVTREIVDVPNGRSLHERPVPRGGGLGIVVTFLAGIVVLALAGVVAARVATGIVGGGLAVATAGWLDDRRGASRRVRALVHFAAAAWLLWWVGGLQTIVVDDVALRLPAMGSILVLAGIVWWTNLYNFMDGIDGLAAGQALTVAGSAGLLMLLVGAGPGAAAPALLLAGAAAGFLIWNWSPARIFMGDVGSGFLGFTFAALAISAENASALPLVVWLLLSMVFLFDSTLTLLRRALRGERWYEAHRTHAYQRLVTAGHTHATVTTAVFVLNAVLAGAALYALRAGQVLPVFAGTLVLFAGIYLWVERVQPMPPALGRRSTHRHELADSGRGTDV